jgi:hypothetical protein
VPADLAFELSYLLSEEMGREIEVLEARLEPGDPPRVCVEARIEGLGARRACAPLAACRGLEGPRLARCAAKTLAQGGRPLRLLAKGLLGG